jgi:hypothetical protein
MKQINIIYDYEYKCYSSYIELKNTYLRKDRKAKEILLILYNE